MSKALDGYAVLITGGSTGLGLSHARVLGQRGAKIAITDFKQGNLDQAAAELHKEGLRPLCLKADNRVVSDVKRRRWESGSRIRQDRRSGQQCRHLDREAGARDAGEGLGCRR